LLFFHLDNCLQRILVNVVCSSRSNMKHRCLKRFLLFFIYFLSQKSTVNVLTDTDIEALGLDLSHFIGLDWIMARGLGNDSVVYLLFTTI